MMNTNRVHHVDDPHFKTAWQLYEKAFPEEERRTIEEQKQVITLAYYHFEVIFEQEVFIGFLMWWDFSPYRFIEFFATDSIHRNKGFGKQILQEFKNQSHNPILLEVELPHSEINKRRIRFYERAGFHLNTHTYDVPIPDGSRLPLYLMTHPLPITQMDADYFMAKYHPIIFNENYGLNTSSQVSFQIINHGTDLWKQAVHLREQILRVPLGLTFTKEELAEESHHIHIIGQVEEEIMATAVLVPEDTQIKMQRVVVDSVFRNHQIGSKMMEFCEAWALKNKFRSVYCHARNTAVSFYLKNGYQSEGDYFDEDGIPHLCMRKVLV